MNPPWDVRYHKPSGRYMLYLDAGRDVRDGQPLYYATPLLGDEARLWLLNKKKQLVRKLRSRGIPLPVPRGSREGKFRKFCRSLWAYLRGQQP